MTYVCGVDPSNIPPWTPPEADTIDSYKAVFEATLEAARRHGIDVRVAWLPAGAGDVTSTPCSDGDPRTVEQVLADEVNARMWWIQPGLVPLYAGTPCDDGCQFWGGTCPTTCSILTLVDVINSKL